MNFVDQITRFAMHRPDEPAMIDRQRTLTNRDFFAAVTSAEQLLLSHGFSQGGRLGLCFRNDMCHLIFILAAGRIGAAILSVDPRASPDEIAYAIDIGDLSGFVFDTVPAEPPEIPVVDVGATWLERPRHVADFGPARAQDGDMLFVINLSSGTTGRPTPSFTTHRHYSRFQIAMVSDLNRAIGRRYLCATPFAFSATRNLCLYALLGGAVVYFHPPLFRAEDLLDEIVRNRIDCAFMVPTMIRWLLALEPPKTGPLLPDFKALAVAGAMMSGEEKRDATERLTPNLFEFYGTSVVAYMSVLLPHEIASKADSVGRPGLTADVQVVDDDGRELLAGSVGRIRCAAPSWPVNPGIELPAPGSSSPPPRGMAWYYSGELGSFDGDGYLYLKGRVSDLIIRGGANIYPAEVEEALLRHDAVADAAVIGRPDAALGECVVAFVVLDYPIDESALRQYCRDRLVSYKVPEEIVFVETLPKTVGGKTQKHLLAEQVAAKQRQSGPPSDQS